MPSSLSALLSSKTAPSFRFLIVSVDISRRGGLLHDEDAQAFYGPNRELAVSHTPFDLHYLMGPPGEERIRREYHEDVSG